MVVGPPRLEGAGLPWPVVDPTAPWHRLVAAVLLQGALDAYARDGEAMEWLAGDEARDLAAAIGLRRWPPAPEQLASRAELGRRRGVLVDELEADQRRLSRERPSTDAELKGIDAGTLRKHRPRG